MFGFIKKTIITIIGCSGLSGYNALNCVSMNNQERRVTPILVNINSNEPLFSYTVSPSINEVVAAIALIILMGNCIPDVIKKMEIKVFNLHRLMKRVICLGMKLLRVNVDQMQLFVMIDGVRVMINANVNVKN